MTKKSARRPLSGSAYAAIRSDILRGAIAAGSEVTESSLAARYRLGKAPIRAALQRLAQEGLVRPIPRRGHLVTPITLRDVYEMFEMRRLLEPVATRAAAARITPADIAELRRLLDADLSLGTNFNEPNSLFHTVIARAAGNRRLADLLSQLLDEMTRLFTTRPSPDEQERLRAEHVRIIDALERGDPDEAERASRDHVEQALQSVLATIHASDAMLSFEIRTHAAPRAEAKGRARAGGRRAAAGR